MRHTKSILAVSENVQTFHWKQDGNWSSEYDAHLKFVIIHEKDRLQTANHDQQLSKHGHQSKLSSSK